MIKRAFLFNGLFAFLTVAAVFAHDLWLNVDNYYPAAGEKTAAKVVFGHNFPHYDILIPRDKLSEFYYLGPDGAKKEITKITEDRRGEKEGALAGDVAFEREGTYIISAYRKIKGDEKHVPSEKYGKSVVVVGKGSKIVSQPLNQRIEIVPLKNPSEIKPGRAFPVKILFEGKPLSTYVYATYAGYHSEDEPFPVTAKSDKNGEAYVKITRPGVWLIVCSYKRDFSATLTFEVRK